MRAVGYRDSYLGWGEEAANGTQRQGWVLLLALLLTQPQ